MPHPRLSSEPSHTSEDRRDLVIAGWLVLALVAFYLATASGHPPYGDEAVYIGFARTLLERVLPGPAVNGALEYPQMALGQSLLEMPGLLLARLAPGSPAWQSLALNLLPALECALMAAFLFLLVRLPGGGGDGPLLSRRVAAALALATGTATHLWPSSSTHFADTTNTCLMFAAFYLVVRFHRAGSGPWTLILAAWAMGLASLCKNTYLLVWPALGIYGAWAAWQRRPGAGPMASGRLARTAGLIVLPLALAIGVQLWYNDLRYGSPWNLGYHEGRNGSFGFNTPLLVGLYGIFFSSGRSIFLYSPLCLMAFFGWRRLAQRRPAELWLAAGSTLPLTLVYARWWSWHGGWEWGCRFYLFLVPLLMWISAPAWGWLSGPRRPLLTYRLNTVLLALLVSASLFVQSLGVLIHSASAWFVVGNELRVLERPAYQQGVWEIRDDMPFNHFVPEFSPVALNAWLVWATWNRASLSEIALARRAPTHNLNPRWTPERVLPYLGYNVWPWMEWMRPGGSKGLVIGALLVMAALGSVGLGSAFRLTRNIQQANPMPGGQAAPPRKAGRKK